MSFDQRTRNLLQCIFSACSKVLNEKFATQRREPTASTTIGPPLDALAHLPDEDMQDARLLRDRLDLLADGLTAHGKTKLRPGGNPLLGSLRGNHPRSASTPTSSAARNTPAASHDSSTKKPAACPAFCGFRNQSSNGVLHDKSNRSISQF